MTEMDEVDEYFPNGWMEVNCKAIQLISLHGIKA